MLNTNGCSSLERISKKSILALLEARSVIGYKKGERVAYTNNKGVTKTYRILKAGETVLTLDANGEELEVSVSEVKGNEKPVLLDGLSLDSWHVTSFDSRTRVVCVDVDSPKGVRHLSFSLPVVTLS